MTHKVAQAKMEEALEHFRGELKNIRTGHANTAMLDQVTVEVYGTEMRLRDVANVTAPEPRMLVVTPFDASQTGAIGKGIEKANLGVQPIVEANLVRISIPPMDEKMRKEMAKLVNKKKEECKVTIRLIRRDLNESAKKQKQEGTITEDQQKREEKQIQEATDAFCKQVDEIAASKEKEVMTV